MTKEKWQNIVGSIKDNFEVIEEGSEHLDDEGGIDIAYIVFSGPIGRIRLEYIVKPLILGKKTNYSRRIGSETSVDFIYSDDESSDTLIAYKFDEDENDWVEIDAKMFS